MSESPTVGSFAPDFSLPSTQGEVRLSELCRKGRVALAFYQADGTPTCMRELDSFRDDFDLFEDVDAALVAISVDSLESHRRFEERNGEFPFALASDSEGAVSRLYDALDESGKRCRRSLFVVDQDMRVLLHLPVFTPGNPDQYEDFFFALGVSEDN